MDQSGKFRMKHVILLFMISSTFLPFFVYFHHKIYGFINFISVFGEA